MSPETTGVAKLVALLPRRAAARTAPRMFGRQHALRAIRGAPVAHLDRRADRVHGSDREHRARRRQDASQPSFRPRDDQHVRSDGAGDVEL